LLPPARRRPPRPFPRPGRPRRTRPPKRPPCGRWHCLAASPEQSPAAPHLPGIRLAEWRGHASGRAAADRARYMGYPIPKAAVAGPRPNRRSRPSPVTQLRIWNGSSLPLSGRCRTPAQRRQEADDVKTIRDTPGNALP
jgi:hypothetical protein